MDIKILFSLFLLSTFTRGQNPQHSGNFPIFKEYICSVIEGPSKNFKEYPNPPKLTDVVLLGLEQEIATNDSAKIYLDRLSLRSILLHKTMKMPLVISIKWITTMPYLP